MLVISELGPQLTGQVIDPVGMRDRVIADIRRHLSGETGISRDDRERLTNEIADDILGYGPLERLLADDSITEIMVNGPGEIWIERQGRLYETTVRFNDDSHLRRIINRMVAQIGRRIDESSPMVDARLPDGSRVNAIIAPLSLSGPLLTIRKFSRKRLGLQDMVNIGSMSEESVDFLRRCIQAQLNVLISGGTGSGKTTLLNALSSSDPRSRAHRHDRGRGRAPAAPAPRAPPRGAPAEHRGRGRDPDPRPRAELAAHAPRPDHRRRVPWPRGARHAPGDEHGPRRLALDRPRERSARRARAHRDDGADGRLRPAGAGDPAAGVVGARHDRPHRAHGGRLAPRAPRSPRCSAWSPT